MNVQKTVFRTQSTNPVDVFIVSDKGKYGLIKIPNGDNSTITGNMKKEVNLR